jgi:hypothetical protein
MPVVRKRLDFIVFGLYFVTVVIGTSMEVAAQMFVH